MALWIVFSALLCHALSQSPGCGTIHLDGRTTTYEIEFGGVSRTYIVHRPPAYDLNVNTPIPLIFGFPGYTISANYFSNYFGLKEYADTLDYDNTFLSVIVQATRFPSNGNTLSWNDIGCSSSPGPEGCSGSDCNLQTCTGNSGYNVPNGCPNVGGCNWCNCYANDVAFINFLAEEIENNYCINASAEYALGYSQGGMMSHRVGCELSDRFAAIAPFAGQQPRGFNCGPITNNKIGLFNVWGTNDRTVPGNGDTASDGFYYTSVDDVQKVFAEHNGCDTNNAVSYSSSVTCNNCNWQCTTYNSGSDCEQTVECHYNGNHNYPKNNPNQQSSPNFALPVVWPYLQQFVRDTSPKYRNSTKIY